jgi:hypothetical protein
MRPVPRRSHGMPRWTPRWTLVLAAPALGLACSPLSDQHGLGATGSGGSAGAAGASGSSSSAAAGNGGGIVLDAGHVDGGDAGVVCVPGGPNDDVDGDGWTPAQGDCNDCDPNVNPNAYDFPPAPGDQPVDYDCTGAFADGAACDMGLDLASADPLDAARALDLCRTSSGKIDEWGVVSARWVMADGAPPPAAHPAIDNFHLGHGMLPAFGTTVHTQRGARMLALSSGTARQPTDPGYQSVQGFDKGYTGASPMGFPKESPACPSTVTGQPHDPTGVEITVNTPSNVQGFSFDFDFFTYEWPGFICSPFNDFFVAILSPIPPGQSDGNISFDVMGNPVSVNNAFLQVCGCAGNPPAPCVAGGKTFSCSLGDADLLGTGFGFDTAGGQDHGSTGWLTTRAPVAKNSQIVLRWAVYDSTDGILDTTTLVDNWQWIATPGVSVTTIPATH